MRRRPPDPQIVAVAALMAALVFAMTAEGKLFPTPAGGYIHLGDGAINFAAFAFGPWVGGVVGGLGTALADIYVGYAQWAPFSFVIHGLQGVAVGWLSTRMRRMLVVQASPAPSSKADASPDSPPTDPNLGRMQRFLSAIRGRGPEVGRLALAAAVGGLIVVLGYIPAGLILAGEVAWLEVSWNTVQVLIGAVIGIPLFMLVSQAYPPLLRMARRWS